MVVEKDMVATTTVSTPYIEVKEDVTKCSFQSFEIAIATNTKDGLEMPTSHLSQNTWMSLKQTIGKRAKVGYGLGKDLQGIKIAVSMTPKHDRHGLGYQPGNRGRNGRMEDRKSVV